MSGIKRSGRFVIVLAAVAALGIHLPTPSAALVPGGAVVVGSGTAAPGLDATVGTFQTISFSGTTVGAAVAGGGAVVVDDACNLSGVSDIAETAADGDGNVTGSCAGTASITATTHYERLGSVVLLTGVASVNGNLGNLEGLCVFVPTSVQPLRSYQLTCVVATV